MFFEATPVTPETLLTEVRRLADAKYRFVTMSQTVLDEHTLRLYYHFDENLTMTDLRCNSELCHWSPSDAKGMRHLRMDVDKDQLIPSISSVYFARCSLKTRPRISSGCALRACLWTTRAACIWKAKSRAVLTSP